MLKRIAFMLVLLSGLPLAVQAADFDYTYVEGSLISVDASGNGSGSLTGFGLDGSYALSDQVHAIAGYSHVSCCGISQNVFDAGAGWNTQLAEQLDLFIDGEFLSFNATGNGTDSGWGATGGLRAWLAPRFELDGFVTHTDVSGSTENTIGVKGLYSLDRSWRVFAAVSNNSDENSFMIGARFAF